MKVTVNGEAHELEVEEDTPLLWVIRDTLNLTGTKFGCGIARCGACTVHLDGSPVRSCVTPVSECDGRSITTIEGLADGDELHVVQQAWLAEQTPQCGYCQCGQIMSAVALLEKKPDPSDADIDAVMTANICRCGTYDRIRKAIRNAAQRLEEAADAE